MELALVGLAASGKTALFEALTGAAGTSTGHAAHRAILTVPDERVERLAPLFSSAKTTHVALSLVDTPGLAPSGGASAHYNDRILGEIRQSDALLFVIRVFRSDSVAHPGGGLGPARDLNSLLDDLRVSDLAIIEKRLEKLELTMAKEPKDHREPHLAEQHLLRVVRQAIEEGRKPDLSGIGDPELQTARGYGFLVLKPGLTVANVGDLTDQTEEVDVEDLGGCAETAGMPVVVVNAALEGELRDFAPEERADYYEAMGLPGPALASLIEATHRRLDLISFFTANEKECRAWPLPRGSTAPQAAGAVHSDMQHGFIRAEVVPFDELIKAGSMAEAKKHGLARLEGKDYVVRDGDVIFFHFSR